MLLTKLTKFVKIALLTTYPFGITVVGILLYVAQNTIKTVQFGIGESMDAVYGYLLTYEVTAAERVSDFQYIGDILSCHFLWSRQPVLANEILDNTAGIFCCSTVGWFAGNLGHPWSLLQVLYHVIQFKAYIIWIELVGPHGLAQIIE